MNVDIKKTIYAQLASVCDKVFYEEAPSSTVLPYVVYSFPTDSRKYKGQVVSELQVDIYDVDREGYNVGLEIDKKVDDIDEVLDFKSFHEGGTSFWTRRTDRMVIPFPDDEHLRGRRLVYETKTYRSLI